MIWPWDISYNREDHTFVVPFNVDTPQPGYYYIKIFSDNIDDIPTSGENVEYKFPTATSFIAGSNIKSENSSCSSVPNGTTSSTSY